MEELEELNIILDATFGGLIIDRKIQAYSMST